MTDTDEQKEMSYLRQQLAQKEIEIQKLKGENEWLKSKFIIRRSSDLGHTTIPDSAVVGGI